MGIDFFTRASGFRIFRKPGVFLFFEDLQFINPIEYWKNIVRRIIIDKINKENNEGKSKEKNKR